MKTIKEVYDNLKEYDSKQQLTISDDNESIEFKINGDDKIIAWDNYLNVESKGKSITHWHPNCDEIYLYFYKIIKGIETIPTKKKITKSQFKHYLVFIIPTILVLTFCEVISLKNSFLRLIMVIIFIILIYLILGSIKKIKNKLSKDYIPVLNHDYPLECEDPSIEDNEVERIYNCDRKRIILIYKKDKAYIYNVMVKGYDEFTNSFYWCPMNTVGISFYDTKEKAINEALVLYPTNQKYI